MIEYERLFKRAIPTSISINRYSYYPLNREQR